MRLIAALIRHGDYHQRPDTPSAHQPYPLTALGEAQARATVAILKAEIKRQGWFLDTTIDSSCLLRAWQTAGLIAEGLNGSEATGYVVESFDSLAERSLGSAANLSVTEITEVLQQDSRFPVPPSDWKAASHYCLPLPGAESLMQAGQRVAAHLQARMHTLRDRQPPVSGNCLKLFVGHGAAFRHAAFHLGILEYDQLAKLSMYHCRPLFLELLSDNRWRYAGGEWKVRAQNERSD